MKKKVVKAQDHGGDLEKMWYVHWREGGRTVKKYGHLHSIMIVDERRAALESLRLHYQTKVDDDLNGTVLELLKKHVDKLKEEKQWRWKSYQTNMSRLAVLEEFLQKRKITKALMAAFFAMLKKEKHPRTYNCYLAEFRRYFEGIGEGGLLPDDLQSIARAKKKSKPAQWLKKHEVMILEKEIQRVEPDLWLAIKFMYNLALRPGELRMMQAKHFFLDEETVQVPAEISKVNVTRFPRIPKTFLPDLEFIRKMKPDDYIFQSKLRPGMPVGKNHFARKIRAIMNDLGFDESYKPCYSFRHTAAMKGVKDGVPIEQMRRQYGHHSLDQFIEYIRQFNVNDMDDFAEKFTGL